MLGGVVEVMWGAGGRPLDPEGNGRWYGRWTAPDERVLDGAVVLQVEILHLDGRSTCVEVDVDAVARHDGRPEEPILCDAGVEVVDLRRW